MDSIPEPPKKCTCGKTLNVWAHKMLRRPSAIYRCGALFDYIDSKWTVARKCHDATTPTDSGRRRTK